MTYEEYTFTMQPESQDAADVLSAFLAELGFETFDTGDDGHLKAWVQQNTCTSEQVREACDRLEALMGVITDFDSLIPEHRDWNETWERELFTAIDIDGRVHIHAPWQPAADVEYDIIVEPRMAFGTGSHATTSLLMHLLLEQDLKGKRVIDAGCGTGVLGMLCLQRGASQLLSYDIDTWSVENTRHNLALNALDAEVLEGDAGVLADYSGYDLVLANINRNILLQEVPRMVHAIVPGGRLIVSGFYPEDAAMLVAAFAELGLEMERKEEKDGWCAIIFALKFGAKHKKA